MNADRRRSVPIRECTLDNWVCVRREAAAREAGLWEHFLALPHSVFDRAAPPAGLAGLARRGLESWAGAAVIAMVIPVTMAAVIAIFTR